MWFFKNKKQQQPPQQQQQPSALAIPARKSVGIRMEAIGGQGANSAGKILAEAAVLGMGYNGNHFSSFGSEKRGTPVQSYVRFSTTNDPVRSASSIPQPDILVIYHESLISRNPHCLEGASDLVDLVINTQLSPRELNFPTGVQFKNIFTIDASSISQKNNCGINSVMLGAISLACPEISPNIISATLKKFFNKLSDKQREQNEVGFHLGRSRINKDYLRETQSQVTLHQPPLPQYGWQDAPIGGVILDPGNSILKDNSASRKGFIPRLINEICFHCGYCDMVCPDFCFIWKNKPNEAVPSAPMMAQLEGIDYRYCKGCQKCIEVCPVQALVLEPESETP